MNRAVLLGIACTGLMLAASCKQKGPAAPSSGNGGSDDTGEIDPGEDPAIDDGGTESDGATGGIDPAEIVPDLVGFYWEGTCVGSTDPGGHNCPLSDKGTACPTSSNYEKQGIIRDRVFNVLGTPGQEYTVRFEVRGVIGTRCYQNGKRASSAAASETETNNWWYVGGTQYNNSWWNTYELHVSPPTGDPSGDVYYFNGSDTKGGSFCEREATYLVKYRAKFKVMGGGTLTFRLHDSNCKAQQNCGPDTNPNAACAPRIVDLTGMSVQPPESFTQPPTTLLSKTYYPQWLFINATSVTSP
jgi:hypothetical protein